MITHINRKIRAGAAILFLFTFFLVGQLSIVLKRPKEGVKGKYHDRNGL